MQDPALDDGSRGIARLLGKHSRAAAHVAELAQARVVPSDDCALARWWAHRRRGRVGIGHPQIRKSSRSAEADQIGATLLDGEPREPASLGPYLCQRSLKIARKDEACASCRELDAADPADQIDLGLTGLHPSDGGAQSRELVGAEVAREPELRRRDAQGKIRRNERPGSNELDGGEEEAGGGLEGREVDEDLILGAELGEVTPGEKRERA